LQNEIGFNQQKARGKKKRVKREREEASPSLYKKKEERRWEDSLRR